MSRGVNKAIIIGTLGQDPDVKYTSNGKAVANLSVATSENWTKDGQKHEKTEWHRVTMWGKLAEIAGEYLKKGSQAYFEGRIETRKWQDQSGNDRYTTEIIASEMQMLGGKSERSKPESPPKDYIAEPAPQDDGFDDIPF